MLRAEERCKAFKKTEMKKLNLFILSVFLVCIISCKENKEDIDKNDIKQTSFGEPNVNVDNLTMEFTNWWNYHSKNIALEKDFNALNENSEKISKSDFIENLVTGNYIPVKLKNDEDELYYKLFKLNDRVEKSIRSTIKSTSSVVLNHLKMEGKLFPDFNFVDLDGNKYDNQNSFGKTTVIKCWFINCKACIEEFPMLNQFVEKHNGDKGMQFISLAFENKTDLQKFIKNKPLSYAVIPEQKEFMEKSLNVNQYPTHFIVDENGLIEKVFTKANDMIDYLDGNYHVNEDKAPPPPPPPTAG